MILDNKEVHFRDINSVGRALIYGWLKAECGRAAIRLRHNQEDQYIILSADKNEKLTGYRAYQSFWDTNRRFMNSLAEHIENAGIRIEKKMSWDKQEIKITNLDKKSSIKVGLT